MGFDIKQDGDDAAPVAAINVTPLVDVMLVLLIIFMVSMPLMMNQLSIEIPKKSSTPSTALKPKPTMYLIVDDAGQYFFQFGPEGTPEPVAFAALPAWLASQSADYAQELVYVKAAPRIDYGRVVSLIELMGKSGYAKVALDKNENATPLAVDPPTPPG